MAKIITVPDPRLKKRSVEITKIDAGVEKLIRDLKATLNKQKNPEGVGISAPQIGVNKRVFVIKTGFTKDENLSKLKETVFVNPEIIKMSKDTNFDHLAPEDRYFEGCLSIPGLYGEVKRPWSIKVSGVIPTLPVSFPPASGRVNFQRESRNGSPIKSGMTQNTGMTVLTGLDAIYFQHEFDHLNGILFTERVKEQGGKLYKLGKGGNFEPL